MKIRIFSGLLFISIFLVMGYLVYAQQGQPQGPYFGAGPYNPLPAGVPQGYYAPGTRSPSPSNFPSYPSGFGQPNEFPRGMPPLAGSNRRRCELAASVALPSVPPVRMPRPQGSRAIPIQGFSPSSPGGDIIRQRANPYAYYGDDVTRQGAIPYSAGIGIIGFEEEILQGVIAKPQGHSTDSSQSASKMGGGSRQYPVAPIGDPFFYEPISSVEAAFHEVSVFKGSGSRLLRQFGYSLFESPTSTFSAVENVPVGPDYILGPGDDLLLKIWGSMEGQVVLTVDRNGEIKLPSARHWAWFGQSVHA